MIEPTDEMKRAFREAQEARAAELVSEGAPIGAHDILDRGLAAVLAIVERDQPTAKAAPGEDTCGKPEPAGRRTCERRARHDVCIAWVPGGGVDAWVPDYDGMAYEIEQLRAKLAIVERDRCMEPRGHVWHPLARSRASSDEPVEDRKRCAGCEDPAEWHGRHGCDGDFGHCPCPGLVTP